MENDMTYTPPTTEWLTKALAVEMPDIACKRCGREILCGDVKILCGKDCFLIEQRTSAAKGE